MANTKAKKVEQKKAEPFLEPDYDTVILEEIIPDDEGLFTLKEKTGIWVPNANGEENEDGLRSGYIISVGPASNPNRPFRFKKGDLVTFGQYTGRNVQLKGTTYVVLRHLDILFATING